MLCMQLKQLNHGWTFRFGTLYLSCNFACFSSHVPGLVNLVLPLKVAETEIVKTFCWIVEFNFLFQLLLVSLDKICFLWCEECWKDWIKCWILCITKLRADLWTRTSTYLFNTDSSFRMSTALKSLEQMQTVVPKMKQLCSQCVAGGKLLFLARYLFLSIVRCIFRCASISRRALCLWLTDWLIISQKMYQTFIQSFSYCASSSWFSCLFNWHLLVVQGLYFRGVSIISSITPDIAWRSQTVTLWLRNCASCSPAFADLEKTPAASLPLVPAPLLALGGFCNQTLASTCMIRSSVEGAGSPSRKIDGSAATWEPCEPLMHVFREKVIEQEWIFVQNILSAILGYSETVC